MTPKTVVWSDFRGGDYGDLGGWNAPPGTWTGTNMKVDRDGSLCPRKGAVDLAPITLPAATDPYHLSAVLGPSVERRIFTIMGSSTVSAECVALSSEANAGQAWLAYTRATADPLFTDVPQVVDDETGSYFANADTAGLVNSLLSADHLTRVTSRIGVGPVGQRTWLLALAASGNRMFSVSDLGSVNAAHNRVAFSDTPDPATNAYRYGTLPAANFFLVGSPSRIRRLQPWRAALLIFKGVEVWRFDGEPGGAASLRRTGLMPFDTRHPRGFAVSGDTIWVAGNGKRPVTFDGVKAVEVGHIDLGRVAAHCVVANLNGSGGVVYWDGLDRVYKATAPGSDWVFTGRRWLRWVLPRPDPALLQTDSVSMPAQGPPRYPRQACIQQAFGEDHLFFSEKQKTGGGAVTVPLWRLWLDGDGPGLNNSPRELPGDGSTTALDASFSLPYLVAPDRGQVTVRKITVRGKRWRTGGASTNHFDAAVVVRNRYRAADVSTVCTPSFDEANSAAAGAVGGWSTFVHEMSVLAPAGHAVELVFTNVRGVSVMSVVPDVEWTGQGT